MMKLYMLAAAATLMLSGSASAQDKAQASELTPTLNCHPPSNGAPAWDSQDVGKSAILPSAVCRLPAETLLPALRQLCSAMACPLRCATTARRN